MCWKKDRKNKRKSKFMVAKSLWMCYAYIRTFVLGQTHVRGAFLFEKTEMAG